MQSAWDASAKYKYSEHSTIHNPQEIGADGNVHTWTLELNGEFFRVTREVWESYHKDNAALREAGEKMAEILKFLQLKNDAAHLESAGLWSVNGETEIQVAEAREAWEAANK